MTEAPEWNFIGTFSKRSSTICRQQLLHLEKNYSFFLWIRDLEDLEPKKKNPLVLVLRSGEA